ncbi:MAG: hypothetical protein LBT00_05750 [Spirochaetaceae bacterium]|jgi:hypothetical protein|nr:hypothetical protein [Spirochaetaceae bacterium]
MNKKFFIIGLTVLLGVSLFLLGCPTDADGDDSPGGNWYDALGSGFSEVGNTVTVAGDVRLDKPLTIPAGKTLKIAAGGTLTVVSGGSIVVDAGVGLEVEAGAALAVESGGSLTATAATGVTVAPGAALVVEAAESVVIGSVEFQPGAYAGITEVTGSPTSLTAALVTELGDANTSVSGATVTLTAAPTISGSTVTVPFGVTLAVDGSVTLTIGSGKTLTVEGTLDIPDTGEVVVESGGEYVLGANASGTNEGTITIESGGSTWGKGGNITGEGVTVVEKGGKAFLDAENGAKIYMIGDAPVLDGEAANLAPIILLTGAEAELTFNNTTYRLDGDATLNGIWNGNSESPDNVFSLDESQTLTIGTGSTLTIPNPTDPIQSTALMLQMTSSSVSPLVLGESEAQIVLASKAGIYFYVDDSGFTGSIGDKAWNNFYSDATTKETVNNMHDETYVWSDVLGDGNDEGWLEQ